MEGMTCARSRGRNGPVGVQSSGVVCAARRRERSTCGTQGERAVRRALGLCELGAAADAASRRDMIRFQIQQSRCLRWEELGEESRVQEDVKFDHETTP